jgi:hypothetical protein
MLGSVQHTGVVVAEQRAQAASDSSAGLFMMRLAHSHPAVWVVSRTSRVVHAEAVPARRYLRRH